MQEGREGQRRDPACNVACHTPTRGDKWGARKSMTRGLLKPTADRAGEAATTVVAVQTRSRRKHISARHECEEEERGFPGLPHLSHSAGDFGVSSKEAPLRP